MDINYQTGTSEPVRADAPIVVGPKEKVNHVKSWATRWFSITANPSGSGGGRLGLPLLGTHDDEPQHDGEFAEHHRENPIGDPLLVLRP